MPTYTIKVKNQSGKDQYYLLFSAPPAKTNGLKSVWSNVWVKTGRTPSPNGTQTLVITEDLFAICGTSPTALANGVSVTESDWAGPVQLTGTTTDGTRPVVEVKGGTPAFDPKPYGTTSQPNSFGIFMKPYDPVANPNIQIGMGKYDKDGLVVPAFVFTPDGNTEYAITPNKTYYIATGNYSPGDVVDIVSYGAAVAIDFTSAPSGWTSATVTQNSDGTYTPPQFSAPSGQGGRTGLSTANGKKA